MTGIARLWLGLTGAGLAVAAALVLQGPRAGGAAAADPAPSCSSCDARHARLQGLGTNAVGVAE